ncbi:MAG: hypothetical protein ACJ757_00565 [Gaiellaceae bacterium]
MAATIAPLALLATSCGGKSDPYAKSLAKGSEHVEYRGTVLVDGERVPLHGSGDFTNTPDRGTLVVRRGGETIKEVFANNTVYVQVGKEWVSRRVSSSAPETPAQMFRAHLPATVEGGLVRRIALKNRAGSLTIDFSRYGEHVSVTVPRVKGSK